MCTVFHVMFIDLFIIFDYDVLLLSYDCPLIIKTCSCVCVPMDVILFQVGSYYVHMIIYCCPITVL